MNNKDMKKIILRDIFIGIFCFAIILLVSLHQTAIGEGGKIFTARNIIQVSLFFIIGIPIAYIIEKYFSKRKK